MRASARASEELDIFDVAARRSLNLYKVAHYDLTVDKWDNHEEAVLN